MNQTIFELYALIDKISLQIFFKKKMNFHLLTLHKRRDIKFTTNGTKESGGFLYGMNGFKNVCLILDNNEAEKLCTDDDYSWSADPWDS